MWRGANLLNLRQAQGIKGGESVGEVNVAVALGFACERVLFGTAKLLGRAA